MIIVYVLIVLFSTTLGAATGMGGGVIMKPVMDVIGTFDATSIGLLTSSTVLIMSLVSVVRQTRKQKIKLVESVEPIADRESELIPQNEENSIQLSFLSALSLGLGSAAGGLLGQFLFKIITESSPDLMVKIVQNIVLCALVAIIFTYMLVKNKLKTFHFKNPSVFAVAGIFLGIISSFLGIGGGPFNVAVLILLFGMSMKSAVVYSLITIIFSQISKLMSMFIGGIFITAELWYILPFMAAAGVTGALLGSFFSKKMSGRAVEICFNCVQILIFAICVFNIIVNSTAL